MLQLARVSILLFYLNTLGKQVRTVCIALICVSTVFGIACTIVEFLQLVKFHALCTTPVRGQNQFSNSPARCTPVEMLWTGKRPVGYKCIKQSLFFCITGLINLALEVALLTVPLPVIWQLELPKRTKFALCGIFSVGFVYVTL